MKNLILLIFMAIFAVGCNKDPQELSNIRQSYLDNPIYIGEVEGKSLYRSEIYYQHIHNHYIYFFKYETNQPVTINRGVRSGKSSRNEAIVIINGQEYAPVQK